MLVDKDFINNNQLSILACVARRAIKRQGKNHRLSRDSHRPLPSINVTTIMIYDPPLHFHPPPPPVGRPCAINQKGDAAGFLIAESFAGCLSHASIAVNCLRRLDRPSLGLRG